MFDAAAVNGGAATTVSTPIAAKRLWRSFKKERQAADAAPELRIGLAASFTVDTLVQFIGAHLVERQMPPKIAIGPYNQLFQTCRDPEVSFGGQQDAIVLLWRIEDLFLDEITAFLNGDRAIHTPVNDKLSLLVGSIDTLRGNFSGTLLVGVPPFPTGVVAGPLALDNATELGAFHRVIVGKFIDQIGQIRGVRVVDLDAIQRQVGASTSFDERQWYLYRQPFSDAFLYQAGRQIGRIIVASRQVPKKCIVLDCDNTLWGGIVGEDGLDGIQIGQDFPGSAYRDFQKLLLMWRQQGVFLAIASKNNEADVWEVFERHDGMALRREHISAWQINWQPKAEGIPQIARALNIGIDSLVFIDDNPMEITYMQNAWPEITCIALPEDPAGIIAFMQSLTLFDQIDVTDEDRKRADMMRAERDREVLGAQISHDEFLRALDLRIDVFPARSEDLGRITQLVNKTNQFNLTTIRRTLDEVRLLNSAPDFRIYGLRVADRFGEYGLTGVVIAEISADRRRWTIDTLLLSCRVLGRGVETGLVGALADDARSAGAEELIASFIPTSKNSLSASFLSDQGFVPLDERRWRLSLADAPSIPVHIVRLPVEPAVLIDTPE